jgi:hypothetical protein
MDKVTRSSRLRTGELFVRDRNGMPTLQQSEVCSRYSINVSIAYCLNLVQTIFRVLPRPTANAFGSATVFGPALLPGHNGIEFGSPGDSSSLHVDYLSIWW